MNDVNGAKDQQARSGSQAVAALTAAIFCTEKSFKSSAVTAKLVDEKPSRSRRPIVVHKVFDKP